MAKNRKFERSAWRGMTCTERRIARFNKGKNATWVDIRKKKEPMPLAKVTTTKENDGKEKS